MTKEEITPAELHEAYNDTFGSPAGRIVLTDLIYHFGFTTKSTFGNTPEESAANEGQRSLLIYIDKVLNTAPLDPTKKDVEYDGDTGFSD
jgi:hypothetical protein